jgi:hypothetical protein
VKAETLPATSDQLCLEASQNWIRSQAAAPPGERAGAARAAEPRGWGRTSERAALRCFRGRGSAQQAPRESRFEILKCRVRYGL